MLFVYKEMNDCCLRNEINLNISKYRVTRYSRSTNSYSFPYNLNNIVLSIINEFSDLGVIFSSSFNFSIYTSSLLRIENLGFRYVPVRGLSLCTYSIVAINVKPMTTINVKSLSLLLEEVSFRTSRAINLILYDVHHLTIMLH